MEIFTSTETIVEKALRTFPEAGINNFRKLSVRPYKTKIFIVIKLLLTVVFI